MCHATVIILDGISSGDKVVTDDRQLDLEFASHADLEQHSTSNSESCSLTVSAGMNVY